MKKLFLLLMAFTLVFMACERNEPVEPVEPDPIGLPDSLMIIDISNSDTIIYDTVLKESMSISINHFEYNIKWDDENFVYHKPDKFKINSFDIPITEYDKLVTSDVEDELLNMTSEQFESYGSTFLKDNTFTNGFVFTDTGNDVFNIYGYLDFGIKDSTIYEVVFNISEFGQPSYPIYINKESENIYLSDNSLIKISMFPYVYVDNPYNTYEYLYTSVIHSIIFKGEFITYEFKLNENKQYYYLYIFTQGCVGNKI